MSISTSLNLPWCIEDIVRMNDVSFVPPLSGGALDWYYRLQPVTVDSFAELKRLFMAQHIFQVDRLHLLMIYIPFVRSQTRHCMNMSVTSATSILVALRQMTK